MYAGDIELKKQADFIKKLADRLYDSVNGKRIVRTQVVDDAKRLRRELNILRQMTE